jgi:hypothetical protein
VNADARAVVRARSDAGEQLRRSEL